MSAKSLVADCRVSNFRTGDLSTRRLLEQKEHSVLIIRPCVSLSLFISTRSHGLETSLWSLSETQTRFTEKMCQVQEEGWSWL